jgi:hypothetical protein
LVGVIVTAVRTSVSHHNKTAEEEFKSVEKNEQVVENKHPGRFEHK